MKRGNRWRGIATAVLAGAVIMAGCASAKDGGTSTADDSAVGTVEQFTGQAVVPVTETASPVAEPATDGETPDLSGLPAMTGRYLRTKNGGNMVVLEREGPVSFQSTEEEPRFAQLHSGDKVEIKLEFIQETYPGQSEALDIRLLEEGSLEDVDADTLALLTEMGWLEPEQEKDKQVVLGGVLLHSTGRTARVSCGTPDGALASSVAFNRTPTEEGQSNFGYRDIDYIYLDENAAAVKLGGSYILFLADGTVEYEGRFFAADQLSPETLEWLEYYNSLPEEGQRSISMVPHDLIGDIGLEGDRAVETDAQN